MARQLMVTRTFMTTKVKILAVNVETEETSTVEMTLPRTYKDNEAILKMAEKVNENSVLRLVHVISSEVVETLYGMTEADFIANAKPLPPRNSAYADTDSAEN